MSNRLAEGSPPVDPEELKRQVELLGRAYIKLALEAAGNANAILVATRMLPASDSADQIASRARSIGAAIDSTIVTVRDFLPSPWTNKS